MVVVGDDRGMSEEDEAAIQAKVRAIVFPHGSLRHVRHRHPLTRVEGRCTQAAARGSQLHHVCLGGDALFASHCIVLVQVRVCTPFATHTAPHGRRMHHPPKLISHICMGADAHSTIWTSWCTAARCARRASTRGGVAAAWRRRRDSSGRRRR